MVAYSKKGVRCKEHTVLKLSHMCESLQIINKELISEECSLVKSGAEKVGLQFEKQNGTIHHLIHTKIYCREIK